MLRAPEGGSERASRRTTAAVRRWELGGSRGAAEGAEAASRRLVQYSRAPPYYASGASLAGVRFSREASTWLGFGFGFGFGFELGVGVGVALSLSLSLP